MAPVIDYTLPLDELPDPLPIEPLTKPFDVTITPPGSKSITCRAYVLAALAEGESKIIRPLRADDTDRLLESLCTLGAEARWAPGTPGQDGEDVYITGVNGRFPRGGEVNLGDGGTPARFMIAVACLADQPVVVDGSKRMRERPVSEGVDMLRQLGANIEYVEEEGRLPVRVTPSADFKGGELEIGKTASSQFISALMLIGPHVPGGIGIGFTVRPTSQSYLMTTVAMLHDLSLNVDVDAEESTVVFGVLPRHDWFDAAKREREECRYRSIRIHPSIGHFETIAVHPDSSSCAYWWIASAIRPRSRIWIPDVGMGYSEPDYGIYVLLQSQGCEPESRSVSANDDDQAQSCIVAQSLLEPRTSKYDFSDMPDGSLAFAILAATLPRSTTLTGLHTLRVKETDRIAALANELRKIGCTIETTDDSITIDPSTRHDEPVVIETYNDHRMAMAFGVLGLARPGISIKDPGVVNKSYPTFWRDFARLY